MFLAIFKDQLSLYNLFFVFFSILILAEGGNDINVSGNRISSVFRRNKTMFFVNVENYHCVFFILVQSFYASQLL